MHTVKPTAYIRIGSDKAGTTTIARFAGRNKKRLEEVGVIVPVRNCVALIDFLVRKEGLTEIDLFKSKGTPPVLPGDGSALGEFLMNYDDFRDQDLFLTTETLWSRLVKFDILQKSVSDQVVNLLQSIATFFQHHQVKIILHLRRADSYADSSFNQYVKAGGTKSFEDFFKRHQITPPRAIHLLNLLESVFGRESIVIRPFERGQMKGNDLIVDLLWVLGRSNFEYRKTDANNESLHRVLVDVLLDINRGNGKNLSNRELQTISSFLRHDQKLRDVKGFLTKEQREILLEAYSGFYEEVSHRYLDRAPVFGEPLIDSSFTLDETEAAFARKLIFGSVGQSVSVAHLRLIAEST
jgi:hypothetical protein